MESSVSVVQSPTGPIPATTSRALFSDDPGDGNWDPADLVRAFNALPRNRYIPTDKIPNKWHFSLQQIPTHGMVIFLVNPYCQFIHIKALPPYSTKLREILGVVDDNMLMNMIIACLLMKAFVENFDDDSIAPVGRPWSWGTNRATRASGVEAALKDLGVKKPSRKVLVADDKERVLTEQVWNRFQAASELGGRSGVFGLVRSLSSMAAQARQAGAMVPLREHRCVIV
jgi:hypothetical protein